MKTVKRIAVAVAAAAFLATGAQAAPTRVSAQGGEIRDFLATSVTVMFAATQGGGLFKTTDAGANWAWVNTGARYQWKIVKSSAAATRMYIAAENGIWKSADAGDTWTQVTFDPARTVAVDPASTAGADIVLAGVPGTGLLKSTDSGATWTRMPMGGVEAVAGLEPIAIAYGAANSPIVGFACNYRDTSASNQVLHGGVFRSTDGGSNWSNITPTPGNTVPTKCVSGVAISSATTFLVSTRAPVGDGSGRIFKTTNSGGSWAVTGVLFDIESLVADANSATTFWAGTRALGVFRSTDSGSSWVRGDAALHDPQIESGIYAVGTFPGASTIVIVGVRGQGPFRSTSSGAAPYSRPTSGFTADRVRSLTNHASAAPNTYYMALQNGGVMKSTDAGVNWTPVNSGIAVGGNPTDKIGNPATIAAHPSSTSVVYAGFDSLGLQVLDTGTNTWAAEATADGGRLGSSGYSHLPQALAIRSDGRTFYTLFAGSVGGVPGGLYVGSAANTLATVIRPVAEPLTFPIEAGAYRIFVSPTDNNRVFLLVYDSLPYRSTNAGSSPNDWVRVVATEPRTTFMRTAFWDLAEKPGGTTMVASTNKGIFRSTDSGANWARVDSSGLTQTSLSTVAYSSNNILWGGDLGGGLWCSTDDGAAWTAIPLGGLPPAAIREVRVMNGQLHVLTDGAGIYKNSTAACP